MIRVEIGAADFDSGALLAELESLGGGGIASFTGVVRTEGEVAALTPRHYPGMTERVLTEMAEAARERWDLLGVAIVHRVGLLEAGARIVFVATAARHRHAALEACAFLIDRLNTDAQFWKTDRRADGRARGVVARDADAASRARWGG